MYVLIGLSRKLSEADREYELYRLLGTLFSKELSAEDTALQKNGNVNLQMSPLRRPYLSRFVLQYTQKLEER